MKKFIVLIMLVLPLGMGAQEVKIAVVNQMDVFNAMPEIATLESELATMRKQYENEFKLLTDDYDKKMGDYIAQQDSLPENIRMMRMQEIEGIRTRAENFQQMASQEIEKKYQDLITPIQEKLQKAIDAVGEENGYSYIINNNPQILLYVSKSATDATDKVKAKLGIK